MKKSIYIVLGIFVFASCNKTNSLVDRNKNNLKDCIITIKKDIKYLASDELEGRLVGTTGEQKAAKYLSKRFKEIGLDSLEENDGYLQHFVVNKKPNPHSLTPTGKVNALNLAGFIDNDKPYTIVIGAHYDHLGYGHFGTLWDGPSEIHNGADDNASGTSCLLHLATQIVNTPQKYNFLFLLFSGEEMGLWGSNYWVKNTKFDLSTVNCMINLDMVGRLNDKRSLAVNGTGTSPLWNDLLDKKNKYNFELVKKESGVGPSDHTSFYNVDLPVLHFFTGQHSDYHKPSDDFDKVNFSGIMDIGSFIYGIIEGLNGSKMEFTKTIDESENVPDFKVTLGVMPDYLFDGLGMRIDGVKEGRPAFRAGIEKGDIVIKMGDLEIKDMMSYMQALSIIESGSSTTVLIIRNGKVIEKRVTFD